MNYMPGGAAKEPVEVPMTWSTGDKIEMRISQGVRSEPVDAQTPTEVVCGAVRKS